MVKFNPESIKAKPTMLGKTVRQNFASIDEVQQMPNLIEIQKKSYKWFLKEGLDAVLKDMSPIEDYAKTFSLSFLSYRLDSNPKYSIKECKERDVTYAAPMYVTARLLNMETQEIKEQEIFMGDFPLMTESGTFIINGAERAIVSQLVRSPGVFFGQGYDKTGKKLFSATMNPNRGAWLEYETDSSDVFYVRIDKNRKLPVTVLLRAMGLGTNEEIVSLFGEDPRILASFEKDTTASVEEGLIETYRKLRPGEPPSEDSARGHVKALFFDDHRYDLSKFGRFKMNNKLSLARRIRGFVAADAIVAPLTGEILVEPGEKITAAQAEAAENAGVNTVYLDIDGTRVVVFTNHSVNAQNFFDFDVEAECGIRERCNFEQICAILEEANGDVEKQKQLLIERLNARKVWEDESGDGRRPKEYLKHCYDELISNTVTVEDIFASINYINGLDYGIGTTDDIDHLGNRRIRSVGELLQNQFRIGFARMERVIHERMTLQAQDQDAVTPQTLVNIRPVVAAIKEFFGSSPLSQFMDQNNPLAELTHKRRLSALGPGGLSRDRAGFEVRDVHYSHYGRMCPIETPEGPNIGLISYLATYARINDYGFIEAPYRKVAKTYDENGKLIDQVVTDEVVYMTADIEDDYIVAQANEALDEQGHFVKERVSARRRDEILEIEREKIDFVDVSPRMMVSVATAMIPFLENDDCNRALMGSNMQRQAVPLMVTQQPLVATGMEFKAAVDSGVTVVAKECFFFETGEEKIGYSLIKDAPFYLEENAPKIVKVDVVRGVVEHVDANHITIRYELKANDLREKEVLYTHELSKFVRSNQGTCVNQRPIVAKGETIMPGQVLADGPATRNGEISLGKNALIGFMTWEGYNYEDAVLISEKIVREDVYTSIHIEEYETEARETKLGPEEITRDIPNVGDDALKDLDERGIIRVGAEVTAGDILVGKVTPKGETELTAEERLLRAIFGEKAREVRDTSLRVPHGEYGIIVDVKVFTPENCDELQPGVRQVVRCYIAQKRKISVGDKMAGRHGNKGVVSRILPQEDMPFLADGTPLDIVLNPLGVPSRMNIGQVLEVNLGYAAKALGIKAMTPVFDSAREADIRDCLAEGRRVWHGDEQPHSVEELRAISEEKAGQLPAYPTKLDRIMGERGHIIDFSKIELFDDGKSTVYDGRTGEKFDNRVTVGYMYYLKLHHLVDDKIHARSTGPYALVTQQPLGGKAQFGGQRFGEMEVWALEAYGAAYTLQEILTVKSDDVVGRVKTYEAIVKGQDVPHAGIPESFRVLIKEMQSLGLDVRVQDANGEEIDLKQNFDDEETGYDMREDMAGEEVLVEGELDGYSIADADEGFGEDAEERSDEGFSTDLLGGLLGNSADEDF